MAAGTGIELAAISEEEAEHLARVIAKMLSANGQLEKAAKKAQRDRGGINFVLALGAIYGPRLFALWRAWRAAKAPRLSVVEMPTREPEPATARQSPN